MKKIFGTLALVGFVVLTSAAADAATDHSKRNVARPVTTISKRARDAFGFVAPANNVARDVRYYDEALSPPAGH